MITFLLVTAIIMLGLGLISYVSSKRAAHANEELLGAFLTPGRHQVRESERQVCLLLSHRDLDCHQHHPNSGSTFLAVGEVSMNAKQKKPNILFIWGDDIGWQNVHAEH